MSTIKDVARAAGVSVGSVSNVLNGKTVNKELIVKVERAMKELSYRPDATARNLKSTTSNMIGVVLPDVSEEVYREFLMSFERIIRSSGYEIVIKFSRNNRVLEKNAIEACLDMRVAGIVIYSSVSQEFVDEWENEETPMLLITRQHMPRFHGDSIILDYAGAMRHLLQRIRRQKKKKPGLVIERGFYELGNIRNVFLDYYQDESAVKLVESLKEAGFKAMFEIFFHNPDIDVMIAASKSLGEGIRRALLLLHREDIPVYVIRESGWIDDEEAYSREISLSQEQVASQAASLMIGQSQIHESASISLNARIREIESDRIRIPKANDDLRFAMYECSSARSLQMYSMIYERESGRKVTFDLYPYAELETLLYREFAEKSGKYDGFMMDITWLSGMVETGGVKNLDSILKERPAYLKHYMKEAVEDNGKFYESLYALPFMPGAQILFYQRDLFESRSLQIRYERKYRQKLVPPRTWAQFNATAEFFTREYNPDSPVEFGLSLSYGDNVYMAINFLDRLWAYNGSLFDDFGNVCINSNSALSALRSLKQSYLYCSGALLESWDKVAGEFETGRSAMTILYDSDVGNINDPTKSRVAGNLGFAMIPGQVSVQGGWSLALNRYGTHQDAAESFLLWACDIGNSIPLSLLGGSTMREDPFMMQNLEKIQPWKGIVQETAQISRKRYMPPIMDEAKLENRIYTEIIPGEIFSVLRGETSEREALVNMEARITELTDR